MDDYEVQHFLDIVKQGDYIYAGAKSPRYIRRDEGTEYYIQCFYNLCNLALASGMRIGELRGLSWSCVNFKKKYVEVKNQIVKTADDDIWDEPKTEKSKRKIAIDDNTLNELKLYKIISSLMKQCSEISSITNLIFVLRIHGASLLI